MPHCSLMSMGTPLFYFKIEVIIWQIFSGQSLNKNLLSLLFQRNYLKSYLFTTLQTYNIIALHFTATQAYNITTIYVVFQPCVFTAAKNPYHSLARLLCKTILKYFLPLRTQCLRQVTTLQPYLGILLSHILTIRSKNLKILSP